MKHERDLSTGLGVPSSALAIAAHPDDVEFGAGATLAKWAEAGCVVHHLICTDGSKGTWDATADLAALVARRRDEQRAAARALGATGEVRFLDRVDGELVDDRSTRSEIARTIRELRPAVVLGHDPWKRYRLHPDHRNSGFLTVDAVVAARDPHFFPEHRIAHHRPDELLLFEADEPDHDEIVELRHVEARVQALLAHESQLETTHFHRLDDPPVDDLGREAAVASFRAQQIEQLRRADGAMVERFRRVDGL